MERAHGLSSSDAAGTAVQAIDGALDRAGVAAEQGRLARWQWLVGPPARSEQ